MVIGRFFSYVLGFGLALGVGQASAANLKPFNLASDGAGDAAAKMTDVKSKLTGAGFEVVGEYSPYGGVNVVIVTSAALKSNAAKTENGGFGAAVRVSVTKVGGNVQVSYSNPNYMAHSYRLKGKLSDVEGKLKTALGHVKTFGSEDGIEDEDLEDWHYMFGMPYFSDPSEVASGDHAAMVAKVAAGLAAKKAGTSQVFKLDIDGKQTLFGVALSSGDGADKTVMDLIDKGDLKHSAHLPYGLLVSDGKVLVLDGKYRIASSFPDLGMGDFGSISSAPGAIEDAMEKVAE